MCIDRGDDVEKAGDDDEARAPIGYGELDGVRAKTHGPAHEVEQATAEIAEKAKDLENVVRVGVKLTLHGEADGEHADDGDGEQSAAAPFAQQKMSRAGDKPTGDEWKKYEALLCW